MYERPGSEPGWQRKFAEGKMFERMTCDRCATAFNFMQTPRLTRIPRCPRCGSTGAHRWQPSGGQRAA